MSGPTTSTTETVAPQGDRFVVRICPDCGLIHIGPGVPWHAHTCSQPELEEWIVQIIGRLNA